MDGEDEEDVNQEEIVEESSDEDAEVGNDSDDEQGFLNLNGWLLLNRESEEDDEGIYRLLISLRPLTLETLLHSEQV